MTRLLAIDPGDTESAYVIIDTDDYRPLEFAILPNEELLRLVYGGQFTYCTPVAIEWIASYGMPVGATVFDTCRWVGRFFEALVTDHHPESSIQLVKRQPVKLHHTHSPRATDSNVRRALADRFAPRTSNFGKGSKAEPGWFYGFAKDTWAAYAVAVYVADQQKGVHP